MINIYNTKAPTNIYSTYLGAPLEYREKLIQTTYMIKNKKVSNDPTFTFLFHEDKNQKVIATGYQAWEDDPIYSKLLGNILKFIKQNVAQSPEANFRIVNSWAGVYNKGQSVKPHHHSPAIYSFCYYMKAEAPYSPMVFDECGLEIDAKTDLLIVFPSYLKHSVKEVLGEERVFIAGNIASCFT